MTRTRALIVSAAVAIAAAAGVFAAASSISLGADAKASTDEQVAKRTAQLDRYETSLTKLLAEKPPALPPVPADTVATPGRQAVATRVAYQRAAPVVVGGNGEDEREGDDDHEQHGENEHGDDDGPESDD